MPAANRRRPRQQTALSIVIARASWRDTQYRSAAPQGEKMNKGVAKQAVLYRMVLPDHICPYGLKARDLLRRRGFEVEDHPLRTRTETDAFKAEQGVSTTPQIFIGGTRIGGYSDLRTYLGLRASDPDRL